MDTTSIIFSVDDRQDLLSKVIIAYAEMNGKNLLIGQCKSQVFSDHESNVELLSSVRGKRVYLLSTPNTADKIMQLNLAIDSAKRAGASEIIPIVPYFPYSRSDKKDQPRGPIGAKMIAEMLENRGATTVITFDLHADQIQGFFNIPVLHMEGQYTFDEYIREVSVNEGDVILCSPDAGAAKRVKSYRDRMRKYDLELRMVMIDKTRKEANVVDTMVLIGDVKDKNVIVIDDMTDTGGTLCKAAEYLMEEGAKTVRAIVTHGVLSGPAFERIANSKLHNFVCSDTLPIPERVVIDRDGGRFNAKTEDIVYVISCDKQIAKAILAINSHTSINQLKKGL
jgi:ribose-phosphate pyrophosphokinase